LIDRILQRKKFMIDEHPWINKLLFSMEDNDHSVNVEWDENDPEMEEWCSWTEEQQNDFLIEVLNYVFKNNSDVKVVPVNEMEDESNG
jgi:O-glycosyl hydrolase